MTPRPPRLLLLFVLPLVGLAGCKEKPADRVPPADKIVPETAAAPNPEATPKLAPVSAETVEKYGQFLARLSARIDADFAAMAERKFESQAEVFIAMAEVAPTGAKMQVHIAATLKEVGLSREQVTGLLEEPTEKVHEHARAFKRTIENTTTAFGTNHRAAFSALPKGDVQAAMDQVGKAEGKDGMWILPAPESPLSSWTAVHTLAELTAQVQEAAAQSQPLAIHFSAEWAMASKMAEKLMFTHGVVREILFGYRRLYVDVTKRSEDDAAIQQKLGAEGLPRTLFFKNAKPLAAFLAGKGTMPTPSILLGGPQKPERFAKQLSEAK